MEKEKKTKKESEPGRPGPSIGCKPLIPTLLNLSSPRPHKRWLETALYSILSQFQFFIFFFK